MFFFLSVMVLLLPIFMIVVGKQWQTKPPKTINDFYGYRTSRSMKSKEAWYFAHQYFGRIWYVSGIILIPLSIVAMLLLRSNNEDASIVIIMFQTFTTIIGIFPTEHALKKKFHQDYKPNVF